MEWLAIAIGGVLGSWSRYATNLWVRNWTHPAVGTFVVNLVGCFLIGWVFAVAVRGQMSKEMKLALEVGFLGAFTTFSAFGVQSFSFLQEGAWSFALLNILANVLLGLGAVALAFRIFS